MMRRFGSMIGVTLLEILLVLAIAAMILVMSVRYYQSATANQQANTIIEQLQAIAAAGDSISMSTGSYSAVTSTQVQAFLGGSTLALSVPWGGSVSVAGSANSISITYANMPPAVCTIVRQKIQQSPAFSGNSSCSNVTYTSGAAATGGGS